VVDFGLAKLLERGGPSETTTRQILGTPKYMAPEQAQARHDDVGPAADVYALGVILYEVLTGRAPYEGASDVEVLRQSIDGILTHPRHLRPDVPRDLEAICLKAMSRTPARRYRTAIDFSDDLRRFLDGKPTLARPLNWFGRTGRWLRRNDQAVALGVVTIIAALLLTFWLSSRVQTHQLRSDRDIALNAQAERTRIDQQREYARRVRDAYLAWRGGDHKAAAVFLDQASQLARSAGDPLDFTHGYLLRLVKFERAVFLSPDGPVRSVSVSPGGEFLAAGHENGTISVWRRTEGDLVSSVKAHERAVSYLAFGPAGELTSADLPATGIVWDVSPNGTLSRRNSVPPAVSFSSPQLPIARFENLAYTGGLDGIVRAWDSSERELGVPAEVLQHSATGLAVSPNGQGYALAGGAQLAVEAVGKRDGLTVSAPADGAFAMRFFKDQPLRLALLSKSEAVVTELVSNEFKERTRIPSVDRSFTTVCLSSDGSKIAAGDETGNVKIWTYSDLKPLASISIGETAPVKRLAISDDGKIVAARAGGKVNLWLVGDLKPRATIAVDDHVVYQLAPDGTRLYSTNRSGQIKAWSTSTGKEEFTFYGHVGQVTGLGLSPNGRTLVSGGVTGEVKFWDTRQGLELASFCRHSSPVTHIEFSQNGKLLITAGSELAVWNNGRE
jgi:WD40 repeat protein